jgi:ubiquinone/menaquinone biosynthesis C-methylase UbiE
MSAERADARASIRAVYDHSTEIFVEAVGTTLSSRFETPLDLAVLDAFAEEVSSSSSGPVLDIGCGPGRVAAHLAARGLDARGVDISTRMVEAARRAHPGLRFDEGDLTRLPATDAELAAAVYWYSIITTPPEGLPAVWQELDRVLHPDGRVLVSFQVGDGQGRTTEDAYGSARPLTLHAHAVDHVVATLREAGFDLQAQVVRRPQLPHETAPQAHVVCDRNTAPA